MTSVERLKKISPLTTDGPARTHRRPMHSLLTTLGLLLKGGRPRQWTKNALVFMAPAAAGVLGQWTVAQRVIACFLLFCLVASGTYLVNDVVDAQSDRVHPVKFARPVASGTLAPGIALVAGITLVGCGVAGAVLVGPWSFATVITCYVAITLTYSVWLKREPVVELATVASCFVLRAVAGGLVANVHMTSWFLVFTSFAALFIVTGKRYAEYVRLGPRRGVHRQVLDEYSQSFLKSALTIAASITLASYCLWAFDPTGALAHSRHSGLWVQLTVIPVVLATLHILRILDAGDGGEPEELAFNDHLLQGYGLAWLFLVALGLYA